jgi:hypothetical protein
VPVVFVYKDIVWKGVSKLPSSGPVGILFLLSPTPMLGGAKEKLDIEDV